MWRNVQKWGAISGFWSYNSSLRKNCVFDQILLLYLVRSLAMGMGHKNSVKTHKFVNLCDFTEKISKNWWHYTYFYPTPSLKNQTCSSQPLPGINPKSIKEESFVESSSSLWPEAESTKTKGNACSKFSVTNSSTWRNFS